MTLETAAASTSAGSLLGRVIDGRYRLEEELGGGATGSTHRARRAEDSRLVVLKLFDDDVSGDAVRRSRFEWEAATLAGLAHPNVVPILDYGVFAGRRYLVSEWLDGESLAQRMRRAQLPLTAAVGIIRQILAALASVHSARLAHRNLKPTDVYLEWRKQGRERVKLLDFAPVMRPRAVTTGRGSYVPPEFVAGDPLDARSDVYAVGALLSGMLHGGPPDVPALAGPAAAGARRGPVVDSTLQGWIRRAMARDRQERFADAAEMLQQLIDLLPRDLRSPPEGYEASRVSSVSIPSPVRSDTRRNEALRSDPSRSQTMRAESFASVSTSEPRVEEPARVETEPVAKARPTASKSTSSVTIESRKAFARSERARAFIEARAKGRPRSPTPAELDSPLVRQLLLVEASELNQGNEQGARSESTTSNGAASPGWVIAGAELPIESASAAPIEASRVLAQVDALQTSAGAGDPDVGVAASRFASIEASRDPARQERTEPAPVAEPALVGGAAESLAALEAGASHVGFVSAFEPAPASPAACGDPPRQLERSSAELSFPSPTLGTDATGPIEIDSVQLPAGAGRVRGASVSSRPPNRRARREAARLAALDGHAPTAPGIEAPDTKSVLARSREDGLVSGKSSTRRARPRSTDQGSVRDAVVGSATLWLSRLARRAQFSRSFGRASLIAAGVVCVLAVSVAGFRSLEAHDKRASGAVQKALDSMSSRLAVSHESFRDPVRAGTPEISADPATAPADSAAGMDGTAPAAEGGDLSRPPARNPWQDDPLPPELDGIPVLANKGDTGDEPTLRRLRDYIRFNEGDARGFLLLGRLYMNRYWRADALTQFQLAVERDPSVRGAPEIMAVLLDLIVTGKAAQPAEAFIQRVYGREALPAIEAELEKLQRPMSIQRLSAVRAKLLDR